LVIQHVQPGGALPSATVNALIDGVNLTALQGIVPTVTAPSSGSVVVSANGSITFTNASNVSVNGCFTGAFDDYRVVLKITGRSSGNWTNMRLRQAGADLVTATYNGMQFYAHGTATTVQTSTGATASAVDLGPAVNATADGYFDVYGPALGGYTVCQANTTVYSSGNNIYAVRSDWQNTTAAPSDGFTLLSAGGTANTFTGVLRIYGYNNLT
jgi:hypothetical protein